MKNTFYLLIAVLALLGLGLLLGLSNNNKTAPASVSESLRDLDGGEVSDDTTGEIFTVYTEESQILWEGRKNLIPGYKDSGTLNIKEGYFSVLDGQPTAGKIVFDMNSIKVSGTGLKSRESMLEGHLKSPDFFSVEAFPTGEFIISEVRREDNESGQVVLLGTLIIKDITQNVSIPAKVTSDDETVTLEGKTDLDRTLWDIKYGSDKFFDNLADNVIDDFFTVQFKAVAQKQS